MLDTLKKVLKEELPALIEDQSKWDSLIVNRRKPATYRVFTTLKSGLRVCLHKFETCDIHEAFHHPHPWPGAFIILRGSYKMSVGYANSRTDKPQEVANFILPTWASYEILSPLTFHSVIPVTTTYTVMINGAPFAPEVVHQDVRRTGGKDLDKMPEVELKAHLKMFKGLVENYGIYF